MISKFERSIVILSTFLIQCGLCKNENESLLHLFCQCHRTRQLWQEIYGGIRNVLNITIDLSNFDIIMGYHLKNQNYVPINFLIINTKAYIFWCSRHNRTPNIFTVQNRLNASFAEQKWISIKHHKTEIFEKEWHIWEDLFTR